MTEIEAATPEIARRQLHSGVGGTTSAAASNNEQESDALQEQGLLPDTGGRDSDRSDQSLDRDLVAGEAARSRPRLRANLTPRPTISAYTPATGRAIIAHGEHLASWMSVDDLFAQAFAWFDVARELRARNLAVEAVEAS